MKVLFVLISIIVLSFVSCSRTLKKKQCDIVMSPQATGQLIMLPEKSPLETGIVRLGDNLYFILAYMTGADSKYSSTPVFFYPLSEDGQILANYFSFGETEHIRQMTKIRTPWGEGVLFADHGKDGGDFSGGKILLIVKDKISGLFSDKSDQLKLERNFSFNAIAVKNKNNSFDDILIVPFNGPKSKVIYLKVENGLYKDSSDLLPDSWRNFKQCFMTAKAVDVNRDGVDEIALGACDQKANENLSAMDRLLIWQNGRWEFASSKTFPVRKREATWGTVYWTGDAANLLALTHNKGFTKSDVQYFNFDQSKSVFMERPVRLNADRDDRPNYLHKIIHFKNKYFVLIRYAKPDDSLNIAALTPDSRGGLTEESVCRRDNRKKAVLGLDTFVSKNGKESMLLFYYDGSYEIYQ